MASLLPSRYGMIPRNATDAQAPATDGYVAGSDASAAVAAMMVFKAVQAFALPGMGVWHRPDAAVSCQCGNVHSHSVITGADKVSTTPNRVSLRRQEYGRAGAQAWHAYVRARVAGWLTEGLRDAPATTVWGLVAQHRLGIAGDCPIQ